MYLSSYRFTGDSNDLTARYDRLLARFRDEILVHVVVTTDTGLLVIDACPDRATAEEFWTGPEFTGALAEAGLPTPEIRGLGEVHASIMANSTVPA